MVRWLGETGKKIKKLILVAPAIIHSRGWKPLNDLLKFEINPIVKNLADNIIIFVSDDDSRSILESVDIFSKALQINPVRFKGKGHFTFGDMGTEKFPELLEKILE